MNLEEWKKQTKANAVRLEAAMLKKDFESIEQILQDSEKLDRQWIEHSPYKNGTRVHLGGRFGTVTADPTVVINEGAVVCFVIFDGETEPEQVGILPKET